MTAWRSHQECPVARAVRLRALFDAPGTIPSAASREPGTSASIVRSCARHLDLPVSKTRPFGTCCAESGLCLALLGDGLLDGAKGAVKSAGKTVKAAVPGR
jgi:hypothetical protein